MKKSSQILRAQARFLKYIPNFLTICNSLCGFAAMLLLVTAYRAQHGTALQICTISSIMIFSAMIFDVFDGLAARLLNAASLHGIQMDSLSDMVTFGVTPAMMVAIICQCFFQWDAAGTWRLIYVYLMCSIYLGCAALRLATYNVHATLKTHSKGNSDRFSGLPSPGAAAAICVALFFIWNQRDGLTETDMRIAAWILPAYTAILGLLMTSTISYIHAGKWLMSIRRNRRKLPLVVGMLAVVACFRLDGLAFLTLAYIFSGPVMLMFERMFRKRSAGGGR
ncbi:MAG: CDP-alcohol phosphatidyltransferase family protein [Lentisphaeria bacterium]|nr:CDP-alcohol phosphatidyltransferase family protein [Lentisphaeria bacterium]